MRYFQTFSPQKKRRGLLMASEDGAFRTSPKVAFDHRRMDSVVANARSQVEPHEKFDVVMLALPRAVDCVTMQPSDYTTRQTRQRFCTCPWTMSVADVLSVEVGVAEDLMALTP